MAFTDDNGMAVFDGNAQTREGLIKVKKAAWLNPAATGNTLTLTDAHSHDLGTLDAGQVGGAINIPHLEGKTVVGLTVTTIQGGKLYVSYE